jgi:putative membrane protein
METGGGERTLRREEGFFDSEVTAMWWHGDLSWWGWLGMTATMLAFWGLVIWGVVTLVRGGGSGRTDHQSPEDVLAERFAKGEIDKDEYQQRLEVLQSDATKARR